MLNEINFTNPLTLDMQNVLNNHLKGKRFVYRTKYGGETFGVINEVLVTKAITCDPDTATNFSNTISHVKSRSTDAKPELIPVKNHYSAYRFNIIIRSTNKINYDLNDNIYILND